MKLLKLYISAFLAIQLFSTPLFATKHALLIGVSNYPTLPLDYQLYGPSNDVELMYQVLLERGFENENFRFLADDVEGALEPTYANIISELQQLVDRVEPDDFVYLHFSGHGSKQKNPLEDEDEERDGMDEIFLAKDVTVWPESDGLAKNVLVDDQVNEFTKQLTDKGAYVWWVFDSCQSSTMLRGDPPQAIRDRAVPTIILKTHAGNAAINTRGSSNDDNGAFEEKDNSTFVALYGAESNQFASELELPMREPSRRVYGFLTYNLAQLLSSAQPGITYRQLNQQLLQNYAATNISSATPSMEGAMRDNAIFEEDEAERIQQWRIGNTNTGSWIRAGQLHGINQQTTFAIMENATSPDEEILTVASVAQIDTLRSRIETDDDFDGSLEGKFARLLSNEPRFNLIATKPVLPDQPSELQTKAMEIINSLETHSSLKTVSWLPANEVGDITLRFNENNLLFLDPGASLVDDPVAVNLDQTEEELITKVTNTLLSIAKAQNILRLVAKFQSGANKKLIETSLDLKTEDQKIENLDTAQVIDIKDKDELTVRFKANNDYPVGIDVTVLFIDSRYGIHSLYPYEGGQTGRLVPDEIIEPLVLEADVNTKGTEYLLVIAVKADDAAQRSDYSFLAQPTLSTTTRSRGEQTGNESLASISELLTRAAFADQIQTRGFSVKAPKPKYFNMELIRFNVSPKS